MICFALMLLDCTQASQLSYIFPSSKFTEDGTDESHLTLDSICNELRRLLLLLLSLCLVIILVATRGTTERPWEPQTA